MWAMILSLSVIVAYKVGSSVFDKKTGLIFAAVISFNPELIYESKNLYQPYLLPLFSLIFLYFILRNNKTIFSSEYKLHMPTEQELISAVEEEKKNFELNEKI